MERQQMHAATTFHEFPQLPLELKQQIISWAVLENKTIRLNEPTEYAEPGVDDLDYPSDWSEDHFEPQTEAERIFDQLSFNDQDIVDEDQWSELSLPDSLMDAFKHGPEDLRPLSEFAKRQYFAVNKFAIVVMSLGDAEHDRALNGFDCQDTMGTLNQLFADGFILQGDSAAPTGHETTRNQSEAVKPPLEIMVLDGLYDCCPELEDIIELAGIVRNLGFRYERTTLTVGEGICGYERIDVPDTFNNITVSKLLHKALITGFKCAGLPGQEASSPWYDLFSDGEVEELVGGRGPGTLFDKMFGPWNGGAGHLSSGWEGASSTHGDNEGSEGSDSEHGEPKE